MSIEPSVTTEAQDDPAHRRALVRAAMIGALAGLGVLVAPKRADAQQRISLTSLQADINALATRVADLELAVDASAVDIADLFSAIEAIIDGTQAVGKVAGAVKVNSAANAPVAADASSAGTIYFNSSTHKLNFSDGVQWSELFTGNSVAKRDFLTFSLANASSLPIHIKTNIQPSMSVMYRFKIEGYNYGAAAIINSEVVGYAYAGANNLINTAEAQYAPGANLSQYLSQDGYLVLKLVASSFFFAGFSVSGFFNNVAGAGFNVSAVATQQAANL